MGVTNNYAWAVEEGGAAERQASSYVRSEACRVMASVKTLIIPYDDEA